MNQKSHRGIEDIVLSQAVLLVLALNRSSPIPCLFAIPRTPVRGLISRTKPITVVSEKTEESLPDEAVDKPNFDLENGLGTFVSGINEIT